METMRCRECENGTVRMLAVAGRKSHYKNLELTVPSSLELPTCDNCGAEWLDEEATAALDDALGLVYRAELENRARTLIEAVSKEVPMRQVEGLFGLSEGYLSKLKAGRSTPSAEVVALLALLHGDVPGGLKRLKGFWRSDLDLKLNIRVRPPAKKRRIAKPKEEPQRAAYKAKPQGGSHARRS